MIPFKPGPQIAGTVVIDSNGVSWKVLKNIANAQAQPKEGAYYSRVPEPQQAPFQQQLDELKARVAKLEGVPPGVVEPIPEPIPETPNFERYAGSVYKAGNSIKYGSTSKAVNNDSVGSIADIKGVADLIYQGVANPSVIGVSGVSGAYSGRPPILTDKQGSKPYISLLNLPGINYLTNQIPSETFPFAMTFVLRSLPGQLYESWCMVPYLGDMGGKLRVGASDIHTDIDCPTFFRIDIIHIEVDSVNCKIWMNNVLKGSIPTSKWVASGASRKDRNSLGKETNGAPFDWFASYIYYNRNMPDLIANREAILNGIAKEYGLGSMPSEPYCDDVSISQSAGTWKVNFAPKNASPNQVAATQYLWFLCERIAENGGGSYGKQKCIGDKSSLPASAVTGSNNFLTCYVKVGGASQYVKSNSHFF